MTDSSIRTWLLGGLAGLSIACVSGADTATFGESGPGAPITANPSGGMVGTGPIAATGGALGTGGIFSVPGGALSNSGGVIPEFGGSQPGTGGMVASTGGMVASTGGMVATTGGMVASTGGMVASTGGSTAPVGDGFPAESACLKDITDFGAAGPFQYDAVREGSIKMWVPKVPAGCKVPVLHLANGTGASCSSYQRVLNAFASHGFLTTCYESAQTGAGQQGLSAIEAAFQKYPELAAKRIGSTGHSQGGQAAFVVLALAEDKWGMDDYVYAGLSMEPASGFGAQPQGASWQNVYATINSPMFAFSGTADTLVSQSWVERGFAALDDSIEAYHWRGRGTSHIPTPQSETIELGVPWWRWKLLNDPAACTAFKALKGAGSFAWSEIQVQNEAPCP